MIFQILDRQFNTLATMDNSLAGAIHFFNDEFHQYLAEGSSTFDFSVLRNHADTQYLVEGNYLHFTYKSRDYLMTIRRIEADEHQLDITCEDLCFDLINEYVSAYKAPKARKITEYLGDILVDSDVVIGLNEVASYSRTLEWTGESTVLERVLSIANYFDAEVEFITELENDRSLKQITLNIYHKYDDTHQGVGVNRTDIELRFGENVKTVKKTTDITELYTCIKPIGKDGLSIKDVEETITDAGGNVLYYTKKGSLYIYAPQSNDRFGRKNSEKGGYINMPYEYDTESVATLYGNALSQLKKYSEPAVTYEVEGYYDLNVGDVVSIADSGYSPILLLEARVSEMITSFANPENNKTVFSNYRVFDSQISSDLLEMMQQMKDDVAYAVQVANTPIFKISVTGSTVFKNGEGSVELQAAIERANTDITDEYSVFNWKKQNKDGSVDQAWTDAHKNYGKKITITPDDFSDAAVFSYEVETEGKVFLGGAASVVKVYDGENGKTPIKGVDYFDGQDGTDGRSAYLHIRYSQNANGTPMTEDPVNAKYVGLQVSQSPTASTNPADYDWSLVKGADGIPGEPGPDGKTSYLHIKYSDDGGKTFTENNGETVGSWLGQYVDFESADSADVKKYAWSKTKGDDGQTPVVHPAWSWSPDGTDRFTTVYPGENLIRNSTFENGMTGWTGTSYWNIDTSTKLNEHSSVKGAFASSSSSARALRQTLTLGDLAVGDDIVWSVWAKSDTPNSKIHLEIWGSVYSTDATIGTEWTRVSISGKLGAFFSVLVWNTTPGTFWVSETKLERGATTTIYTPAPSEDYANAYPLYEGTYTDYSETASQNPADYTWRRIIGESGQDGVAGSDGKGIKSTAVTYQASTSGTVAPTGTWVANPPTVAKGQYLWTRTIWTYTDNATETGYSVAYVAKDGNDGTDGIAGKDGVGIKSTAITYAVSSSGTTAPTSGWVASPPTATAGQFMWTKTVWTYTDNTTETGYSVGKIGNNGTNGKDGEDGSNGISVASVTEEYYVSTSDTTQTGGSWSTTVPNNANPNLYVWRRVKNTMSDGTVSYTTPALIQGMTGIYPYIGPTQPANTKEGQQWWKSDSNGNVTNFYAYHDGSWQEQTIQQSMLNIVALNAVTITGSTITGTVINGSKFTNTTSYSETGGLVDYTTTIEGNITMDWKAQNSEANGLFTIMPTIMQNDFYGDTAKKNRIGTWTLGSSGLIVGQGNAGVSSFKGAAIGPNGLGMTDPQYAPTYGEVNLKYQDLLTLPTIVIPAASGWSPYATSGGNRPTATRNGRLVQLAGAFKNNAEIGDGGDIERIMGNLPVGYRPASYVKFIVQASAERIYLLTVEEDGRVTLTRHRGWDGSKFGYYKVPAGSWLNIACCYTAADI